MIGSVLRHAVLANDLGVPERKTITISVQRSKFFKAKNQKKYTTNDNESPLKRETQYCSLLGLDDSNSPNVYTLIDGEEHRLKPEFIRWVNDNSV